mgnify:CR=1 FL=1
MDEQRDWKRGGEGQDQLEFCRFEWLLHTDCSQVSYSATRARGEQIMLDGISGTVRLVHLFWGVGICTAFGRANNIVILFLASIFSTGGS